MRVPSVCEEGITCLKGIFSPPSSQSVDVSDIKKKENVFFELIFAKGHLAYNQNSFQSGCVEAKLYVFSYIHAILRILCERHKADVVEI